MNIRNLIFAHRGIYNNKKIPENSFASFIMALNRKINIELDIHILKDNNIVVFHDNSLFRMTGQRGFIKNYTYAKLKKIKLLKTDYHIPLLKEILNLVNGKVVINIEIKNDQRNKKVVKELIKILSDYNGQVIMQSFYPSILYYLKDSPYIYGLLILDFSLKRKINLSKFLIKPSFLAIPKGLIKNEKVQLLRSKFVFFVYTLNNEDNILLYKEYANSFIIHFFA